MDPFLFLPLPILTLLHLGLVQVRGRALAQKAVARLGIAVSVAFGGAAWFAAGAIPERAWLGAYGFLLAATEAYAYFHVFNMALTARRIQLLVGQKETNPYDGARAVAMRLDRLRALGCLVERGGQLRARPGFLLAAAWVLHRLRGLFYPKG